MGLLRNCKCSFGAYLFGGGKNSSAGLMGSPLEKVLSTAGGEEKYVIYRLVSHRHGGLLVELFQKRGIKEVERYVRQELPQYLYNAGRGQNVTLSDYLRWKNSIGVYADDSAASVDLTMESVMVAMHRPDPFNKFDEHEACWKLEHRGALGETLLHVLVTCDTPTHTKIAKLLLDLYPKMALDVVEGVEYFGTSALHLAVAYNNMALVGILIECGSDVNRRATGRFFLPSDQQLGPRRGTDYSGLSYLGEYVLAWAACAENEAAYNMLLDHGSDPNLQDSLGNMVLHMVVIADKLDMYSYALRHPKRPANNEIVNKAGLTPLALACTLGRDQIFREMLELSSVEFWRYSNITCSAYPLSALDSILPDGKTNWKSALMIILNGETDEHLDMLGSGVVQRLLEDKWKTFARKQFLFRLALLFLHLLVLSIGVYLRPRINESLLGGADVKSAIRYCAELATCGGCTMFVLVQQGGEIRSQGLTAFLLSLTRAPPKLIFLVSNILILICIPLRLLSMRSIEDSLLLFAVPGSWFFLMFFAGAVRLTGPFVTMIYSMISGDMVRFGIIYLVVLLGFSQVFYFLFKSCHRSGENCKDDDSSIQIYGTYAGTWMALYQMTLGNHQYQDFSLPEYSTLSLVVFVIFMVMVPILLLNMLTAMMGNTYSTIISKSEKEFFKQWAKIVLTQERAVSPANAAVYIDQYAINLAPSPSTGELQKGLVVIKEKSKTKARQRKGALLNWKKIGKKAIKEMRTHACSGDVLLAKVAEANERKAARRPVPGKGRVLEHCDVESSSSSSSDSEEAAAEAARQGLGVAIEQMAWHHDINIEAGVLGSTNQSAPVKPVKAVKKESKRTTKMKRAAELHKMVAAKETARRGEATLVETLSPEGKLEKWRKKAAWVAKADGVVKEVQRQMEMEDDAGQLAVAERQPKQVSGKEARGSERMPQDGAACGKMNVEKRDENGLKGSGNDAKIDVVDSERLVTEFRLKIEEEVAKNAQAESLGKRQDEAGAGQEKLASKRAEEEVVSKKVPDEALVSGDAEEELATKEVDEDLVNTENEELARKNAEEEELLKKKLEELVNKRVEEELVTKKVEELVNKKAEELLKKKAEEEELLKKKAEEEEEHLKKKAEEELLKKKAEEEELLKKKAEEEELSRKKAEEEELLKKKAEEELLKKKAEEELLKKKVEEVLQKKGTGVGEKSQDEDNIAKFSDEGAKKSSMQSEKAGRCPSLRPKMTTASLRPRTPCAESESNSGEDSDPRPGPLLLPPIAKHKRRKQKRGSLKGRYALANQGQVPSSSPGPGPTPISCRMRVRRNNKVGASDGSPSSADTMRPETVPVPERPRTAHMSPSAWSTAPVHSLSKLLDKRGISGSEETG